MLREKSLLTRLRRILLRRHSMTLKLPRNCYSIRLACHSPFLGTPQLNNSDEVIIARRLHLPLEIAISIPSRITLRVKVRSIYVIRVSNLFAYSQPERNYTRLAVPFLSIFSPSVSCFRAELSSNVNDSATVRSIGFGNFAGIRLSSLKILFFHLFRLCQRERARVDFPPPREAFSHRKKSAR